VTGYAFYYAKSSIDQDMERSMLIIADFADLQIISLEIFHQEICHQEK